MARSGLLPRPGQVSVRPGGYRHEVRLRLGTSDLDTYIQIFEGGAYDFHYGSEPGVIIDAGANVGYASVYFANAFPRARILAIEPENSNYEMLKRNADPYPNVIPIRAALWNTNRLVDLFDPGRRHGGFQTRTITDPSRSNQAVEGMTVDRLMSDYGVDHVDLLKVDIEGAEREVFDDASGWIDRVSTIAIETHDRLKPGCSEAVENATRDFSIRYERGQNLFLARPELTFTRPNGLHQPPLGS